MFNFIRQLFAQYKSPSIPLEPPQMQNEIEYFSEDDMSPRQLQAGLSNGTIEAWRPGAGDKQWYRSVPKRMIHGVSSSPSIQGYDEVDDDDELTADQQAELDALEAEMVFDQASFEARIEQKKQLARRRAAFPFSDDSEGDDDE